MAKLFISYARSTAARARLIAETLEAEGNEVWIDDQLLSHRSFTDSIEEKLNSADAVVVAWSEDAARSEWVRAEANRARLAGKLVQVRLDSCALPLPYDEIHCIDLSSWSGDFQVSQWRAVLASIAAVTGSPARLASMASGRPSTGRLTGAVGEQRRGERRQVTALYCDLMDAGSLAASLDPEDMMQVLDIYQAACDDIIAQHGGSIAKYMGHGLLAYFGYPRGDEEEAANAVRAGLALRNSVSDLPLPAGVALRTRVGVATGMVVVSELVGRGDGHETGIVGETPNLAAQLESVASHSGVVVAEATRRITAGLFTYRDLGAVNLAGYDTPLRAFEAVEATQIASRSQARARGAGTPLFGREAELTELLEAWALAGTGKGQVALVQGDAGIGKSLLVETFRQRASVGPDTQVTWYCSPNFSDSALNPISEQMARAAGFERGESAEARGQKLAALLDRNGAEGIQRHTVIRDLLGVPPAVGSPVVALTPERRKAVTLDTVLGMMEHLSREQPALFVIEDLHCADPTTLELLDRAIRGVADRPWLILATARPEYESRWADHADLIHIQLGRLHRTDAERICERLGAEALLSAEVVRQIIARSDGNPLFVEEVTRSMLESVSTGLNSNAATRVAIPDTLQDSLAARLDRLGAAKEIASLGAAIGRRFSYELLAAVATQPATELRQALRELVKSGIIERNGVPPRSHYLFKHALIRDAAYQSLLKREREVLHGRIAGALRDIFPDTHQTEPALLAYHLTESGAGAEAIPLWVEAGQRAASRAAHVEAVSYLRTALELVRRQPEGEARARQELTLLLGLAPSLSASLGFSVPEVATVLNEARAICDTLGDVAGLYAMLAGLSGYANVSGDVDTADDAARRCMEIGEQTGLAEPRIEGYRLLGYQAWKKGDLRVAQTYCEKAIRLYREVDGARLTFPTPMDPLVISLSTLPLILGARGDMAGAERALGELIAHARSLGQPFALAFGYSYHAVHDLLHDNQPRALRFAEDVLEISEQNGYDSYRAAALVFKASAEPRNRRLDAAVDMATRGITEWTRGGNVHMLSFFEGELADLQAAAGDASGALATINSAIANAKVSKDLFFLSPLLRRRADILARLPVPDRAAIGQTLREALTVAEAQGAAGFAARVVLTPIDAAG